MAIILLRMRGIPPLLVEVILFSKILSSVFKMLAKHRAGSGRYKGYRKVAKVIGS